MVSKSLIERVFVRCYDCMLKILDSLHLIAPLHSAHPGAMGMEAVDMMVSRNWWIVDRARDVDS
jgi:hypothetical protein